MQPFGTIKNPKINVQTKKQPPVHRYPVPYSVNQPTVPTTGPTGMPPKMTKPSFAEDSTKMSFDPSQTFESQTEFSVTEHQIERNRTPSQTPDDFGNDLHSHHKGNSLEVTPASFGKGQKLADSPIKDEGNSKGITPEKRVIGMKDDDEYVRMASADEEEDEEPIVQKTKERILPTQKAKIDAPRRYQDEDAPVSYNKTPNLSQFEDTSALLKIKRIELELAKEKNKNEFLEAEQIKLINENTELKRRVEELHARADLAEKYDNRERLAKKEEEAERLKLEVNRLVDENRILEAYSQKVLQANAVYRQESDSLIASQQAEKRRFMEELHSLKRQLEERENPSNILKERNEILESQLYELRQQVSLLTNQLALKAETNQKMNEFTEEIQSIVSTLSNVTMQTQTQTAAHYSQHAQTSPVKFENKFPATTIDTQTYPAQTDSHHAQTSPEKAQVSPVKVHPVQSPFKIQQKTPESHTVDNVHNVPAFQSSPPKAENYASQIESVEQIQHHEDIAPPQNRVPEVETEVHHNVQPFEETKASPVKEEQHVEQETEGPPKAEFHPIEQEIPHHHQAPSEIPVSIPHHHEVNPHVVHPPVFHPPQHTQVSTEPQSAEHGILASFNTSETNDKVSGTGLIAPPKYKIPVRPIPKKVVPGFKPMTHHTNPFSEQGAATHPEQNTDFGAAINPETNPQPEAPPQHVSQPAVEAQPEPHEQIIHNVQVEEPSQVEQPQHVEEQVPPVQEPVKEEKIEGPPRSILPSGTNAPPAFKPFVAGRPPVSMIPKAKVQKIGKNPFSSENEGESSAFLGSTMSQDQPVETVPPQQNAALTSQHEHSTGFAAEDLAKSFSQEGQGAAESFFDQLGQNPSQSIDASGPVNNYTSQDISSSDLMRSFQTESGLSAEKVAEVNKTPVTKAVPIKKKKAALPSNMFD